MIITDFKLEHTKDASKLLKLSYDLERSYVSHIPPCPTFPSLDNFCKEEFFGVSAFEDDVLVGFMCFFPYRDNCVTTSARGSFAPIHGHGAQTENRELIYKKMYQAISDKLIKSRVTSHAIALYAHDSEALPWHRLPPPATTIPLLPSHHHPFGV